ncbi:hypothetical protein VPH35_119658 [Triticum aestivum]
MSSFTGISIVQGHDGRSCNTSAVDAGTDSGYHLFMVKGYSRTKELMLMGDSITAGPFIVGGHDWLIEVSFTLVDQVDKHTPMYIRATNPACRFKSNDAWGDDKFLRRDALE